MPTPSEDLFPIPAPLASPEDVPGAVICLKEKIKINVGRKRWLVEVKNEGDRPVQVGSHFHFLEVNKSLRFDRLLGYGRRLDIAAGTAVRFEPGERKTVSLVDVGGTQFLHGGNGLGAGPFEESKRNGVVFENVTARGFSHKKQDVVKPAPPHEIDREVVSGNEGRGHTDVSTRPCSARPRVTASGLVTRTSGSRLRRTLPCTATRPSSVVVSDSGSGARRGACG